MALRWGRWHVRGSVPGLHSADPYCPFPTHSSLPQNNAQRLGVSQSTHSLTTPVVSVATPSLLSQGLPFSSMPTAYNTGECAGVRPRLGV